MAFGGLIITRLGRNALANAQLDGTLKLSHIAIGDGLYSGSYNDITALKNQKFTVNIGKTEIDGDTCVLEADISNFNLTEGYYLREIGIFAKIDDTEILYAYDNANSDAEYIPKYEGGINIEKRLRFTINIGNVSNVTLATESVLYLPQVYFEEHEKVIGSETTYGHVMASSELPLVAGDANAGKDNGRYARESHVHPEQKSVSGNAGTATKLANARTLTYTGDASGSSSFDGSANVSTALTLANSGATAGSYGPAAAATLAFGGTTNVPQITVDTKGRATTVVNRAITLPAAPTTVSGNAGTASKLATVRTIALSGGATGTATSFDGSANITIPVTGLNMGNATAGTLPIARGGTGATDAAAARDNLGVTQAIAAVQTKADAAKVDEYGLFVDDRETAATGYWHKVLTCKIGAYSNTDINIRLSVMQLYGAAAGTRGPSGDLLINVRQDTNGAISTSAAKLCWLTTNCDVTSWLNYFAINAVADSTGNYVELYIYNKIQWAGYKVCVIDKSPRANQLTFTGHVSWAATTTLTTLPANGTIVYSTVSGSTKLTTARTLSYTGDATGSTSFDGSANVSTALTLTNSGVAAGSYGPTAAAALGFGGSVNIPQVTVDSKGRTTSVVNRAITLPATPTTVSGNAGTATKLATARTLSLTGDATGSMSFDGSANASAALTLANSGVTAGSYGPSAAAALAFGGSVNVPQVTVDAKGRTTAIANRAITLPGTPTSVSGNAGTATKLAAARTIGVSGVTGTAQSFDGSANITIPITSVPVSLLTGSCITATGDWNSYTSTGFYMGSSLTNSPPATNGSHTWWYVIVMNHNASYQLQIATDFNNKATYRRVCNSSTWGSWILMLDTTVGNAVTASKLLTARTLSYTGDATGSMSFDGSANVSTALTLANSGVTAGSYGPTAAATLGFGGSLNVPQVTVDSKGRATTITNRAITLPAAPTTVSGNAGTATKLATARTLSYTGDATGSVSFDGSTNVSTALTLASSGATAGSYGPTAAATLSFGGSVNVPQVTVDAKGRATSVANRAITLPATPTTVSGNAGTATKLATARTIALSGGATGTATNFDGTANITIPITGLNMGNATAGTLAIARGGTGATTAAAALTNLGVKIETGTLSLTDNQTKSSVSSNTTYTKFTVGSISYIEINLVYAFTPSTGASSMYLYGFPKPKLGTNRIAWSSETLPCPSGQSQIPGGFGIDTNGNAQFIVLAIGSGGSGQWGWNTQAGKIHNINAHFGYFLA